jgi:hypothetical protein
MAYDKAKIFEQAKELTIKHKLFFIEDIVAMLPCSKPTFYEFFPLESNELNELKELIDTNKTSIKIGLRKKWNDSEAPALQLSLYKLICSNEERKNLSMQHNDITTDGKDIQSITVFRIPDNERDGNIE